MAFKGVWMRPLKKNWVEDAKPTPASGDALASVFYMKYSVNAGRISSVAKIVNFVGGATSE